LTYLANRYQKKFQLSPAFLGAISLVFHCDVYMEINYCVYYHDEDAAIVDATVEGGCYLPSEKVKKETEGSFIDVLRTFGSLHVIYVSYV
jgi:hypothetical protein